MAGRPEPGGRLAVGQGRRLAVPDPVDQRVKLRIGERGPRVQGGNRLGGAPDGQVPAGCDAGRDAGRHAGQRPAGVLAGTGPF
nr:hypothetical protein [uncultured bacterium]